MQFLKQWPACRVPQIFAKLAIWHYNHGHPETGKDNREDCLPETNCSGRTRCGCGLENTGMVPVVGENMNNRLKKKLLYRRHRIGLLIAAIESLQNLEQSFQESEKAK